MASATDDLLNLPPFGLTPEAKAAALLPAIHEALVYHYEHCGPFARWCAHERFDPREEMRDLAAVPFLPVNIFKRMSLCSVPPTEVVRTVSSSGTSSQAPSRVPLDAVTRSRQMRALAAILAHRLGGRRRPFLVLDAPPDAPAADRELSARVAGMRGYLLAASESEYVLRREGAGLALDRDKLLSVVQRWKAGGQPFCLLGYTYVLYQEVLRPLAEQGIRIELPDSTFVLHFGGWKRLRDQAVDKAALGALAEEVFGIGRQAICDIYGFTEQLGVVYPDGPDGLKRAPTCAEVIVRDPRTLEPAADGQTGLLEFICPLPHSYPGVAVLLDDLGRIVSRDAAPATGYPGGMMGTAFEVLGRAEHAEIRGCGDTLAPP
ncbi:MAG: hypothetical protein ABR915_18380 [Thermoguttaceae bacterium]